MTRVRRLTWVGEAVWRGVGTPFGGGRDSCIETQFRGHEFPRLPSFLFQVALAGHEYLGLDRNPMSVEKRPSGFGHDEFKAIEPLLPILQVQFDQNRVVQGCANVEALGRQADHGCPQDFAACRLHGEVQRAQGGRLALLQRRLAPVRRQKLPT